MHVSKDWTTPGPYLRGNHHLSRRERLLAALAEIVAIAHAARASRHEVRQRRRLRAATGDLPAYLRRDIGLPPE
jgi:hypothetical protein